MMGMTGGSEPWGTYGDNKQIHQEWGIDATLVEIPGRGTYYVWSCMSTWNGEDLQSLCIAPLKTGTSIGPWSVLSRPTEAWERIGIPVNEGPAGLNHAGKTWVAYSASFCKTPDYSIATLLWDGVSDPLLATSWTKSGGPLFRSAHGNYGTAHNGCVYLGHVYDDGTD
jgi:GH43 family beta-xylosidase